VVIEFERQVGEHVEGKRKERPGGTYADGVLVAAQIDVAEEEAAADSPVDLLDCFGVVLQLLQPGPQALHVVTQHCARAEVGNQLRVGVAG